MMHSTPWPEALHHLHEHKIAYVLITVLGTHGSAPRKAGAKMLVTADESYDTIGGGKLEYRAVEHARALLKRGEAMQDLEHIALASKTQQCCGGKMSILYECFAAPLQRIHVYGAGHIARELLPLIAKLPVQLHWVDTREALLEAPAGVLTECHLYEQYCEHIANVNDGDIHLIMTHDHAADYALVEALLDRKHQRFIGMVGSETKALRFRRRLRSASFSDDDIAQLCSPLGLLDIPGQTPFHIAISIVGQLLTLLEADTQPSSSKSGVSWPQLKQHYLANETVETDNGHSSL